MGRKREHQVEAEEEFTFGFNGYPKMREPVINRILGSVGSFAEGLFRNTVGLVFSSKSKTNLNDQKDSLLADQSMNEEQDETPKYVGLEIESRRAAQRFFYHQNGGEAVATKLFEHDKRQFNCPIPSPSKPIGNNVGLASRYDGSEMM